MAEEKQKQKVWKLQLRAEDIDTLGIDVSQDSRSIYNEVRKKLGLEPISGQVSSKQELINQLKAKGVKAEFEQLTTSELLRLASKNLK
jgi:hypothetical protein